MRRPFAIGPRGRRRPARGWSWWRDSAGWISTDPTAGWVGAKVVVDTTRALTRAQVEALFRLDVGLREKTLWRLLYESAGRAEEILTLDIADLDLPSKRARVISKGGKTEWVFWQSGAAQLLPRLLAVAPVARCFLTDRRAVRAVAGGDLDLDTGRARLSYRRRPSCSLSTPVLWAARCSAPTASRCTNCGTAL